MNSAVHDHCLSTKLGGIVLWKVTPLFAEWLSSPTNPLFNSILTASSSVLELGCGISPLNAFAVAPRISQYVLSDQTYVQKLVTQNLAANPLPTKKSKSKTKSAPESQNIEFRVLDWEEDEVTTTLASPASSFDVVVATDCVFNYALVEPFVQTCVDVCMLREKEGQDEERQPCVCVVAQQLRNDDVFRSWLSAFMAKFRVWRVREELLKGLTAGDGFVVHVGVLRDAGKPAD